MRMPTLKFLTVIGILLAGVIAVSCAPAAPAPAPTPTPTPGVPAPKTPATPATPAPAPAKKIVEAAAMPGPISGTAYPQMATLSKLLKDYSPWMRLTPVAVAGFTKGVEFWEEGKATGTYVLYFSNTMIIEYTTGTGTYKKQGPRNDQGLLFPSYTLGNFVITQKGSGITKLEDIKGKTVALGTPGTTSMLVAIDMLQDGAGLKAGEDYKALYLAIADIVTAHKEGTAQVATWSQITAKGLPYAYLEDATSGRATTYIPVTQAHIDKMNKAKGANVYFITRVPAGVYRGQDTDIPWVGVANFVVLPLMYSEDIGYELTRVWWEYWDQGIDTNPAMGHSTPQLLKEALKAKWGFAWHPGAIKYYKEKGWM